jgi:LysR family hydrogen peroxide-inducible transcriptional activator
MAPQNPHRLPTVKQLQYFTALAELGHFGRAADQCYVSQSAFSTAIQDLEALLEVQLVDRTNRRVAITATGKEVATLARLCLRDINSLVEHARSAGKPLHGTLRLGIIPTIAPFLLPHVLPAIRQEYPGLKLLLTEDITATLRSQLSEGLLDAAIVALPTDLPGLEKQRLFRDRFLLAARRDTQLVDPKNFRLNRLNEGSVLLLRDGHCMREHALEACRIRDSRALTDFSASSLLTLIEMVDADLGLTFLPEMAVGSALLAHTQIELYPLKDNQYRDIGIAWRRGSARSVEFRALGRCIAENRPAQS